VVIAAGAVQVTIQTAPGTDPQAITSAVRAGVDPALVQLARAITAL
jgi:hypothetical protein